ncbi:hypothetical protein P22_1455 [Propionispora sp. 2/2-37]|uniref:TonB-dependent receptor n=1 Tax=Propionispora sp. 2/2-37 TaxID=1677858 RepID=UPI0006BB8ECA|nr:TonB-dependent receptor [Propionispora sp. 2/2-37]CUH95385.1 hypothetical protein P22_1455 [Propionispora sp. 2/2-37]
MNKSRKTNRKVMLTSVICSALMLSTTVMANAEEYRLDEVVVTASKTKEAGNPNITGGDVNVVTREDIEKHNYTTIEEAIKKIPGVQVATPGYRGGEYGYANYNTEVSINGENNIVILVDGRRIDNDVMSYAGNKSKVNLSTITGIDNVERIEVIKGSGSAIYGADAAGGVINIITRKGAQQPTTTLTLESGSWGRHNYSLTHSGSSDDGSLKYFMAIGRQMSKDSKYKDAYTDSTQQYYNTGYRDENGSVNIEKNFDANHSLNFSFSHTYEKAHYPITAADYANIDRLYNGTLSTTSTSPGYRNWFLYDAWLGSYTETKSNDVDLKYTFEKDQDNYLESFIRVYKNYRWYNTADYSDLWGTQYPDLTEDDWAAAKASGNLHTDIETVKGAVLQVGRQLDNHSVTSGIDYRHSEYEGTTSSRRYDSDRDSLRLFSQDKIKVSDKFTFTPGLNYTRYGSTSYNNTKYSTGVTTSSFGDATNRLTFSSFANYQANDSTDVYFSWAQIFKPVSGLDYSRQSASDPLEDEKGTSWTIGTHKTLSNKDSLNISYGVTDMSNAIARYSIRNSTDDGWETKAVNASRKKKAFNTGYTHAFDTIWNLTASYAYVDENYHTKRTTINPDGTSAEQLINAFRPKNVYQLDLGYDKGKWSGDLAYTVYSGCDKTYFTDNRFGIVDIGVNYKLTSQTKVYFKMNNVLNTAYETKSISAYGTGAFPQPGRNFMLGVNYTF